MGSHHRELAREIFVVATELLEDTHEVAVAGQSPKLNAPACKQLGHKLQKAAHDLAALANCAIVIADVHEWAHYSPSHRQRDKRTAAVMKAHRACRSII